MDTTGADCSTKRPSRSESKKMERGNGRRVCFSNTQNTTNESCGSQIQGIVRVWLSKDLFFVALALGFCFVPLLLTHCLTAPAPLPSPQSPSISNSFSPTHPQTTACMHTTLARRPPLSVCCSYSCSLWPARQGFWVPTPWIKRGSEHAGTHGMR